MGPKTPPPPILGIFIINLSGEETGKLSLICLKKQFSLRLFLSGQQAPVNGRRG